MIFITVESSISNISLPDIGISFTDKIIHFGLFGILGWLLARGFYSGQLKYPLLLSLLVGTIFAATDELHQAFVPGRDGDINDFAADVLGLLIFILAYKLFIQKFKRVKT